ncbi:unnamed protein product (macronuclear) [Paramecium tetraurelia]|uniref:Protein kinase domain-containing protein n=1 Tax=Paramecium tetraurelia TaxID=5888 RepID=A0C4B8_PARTE|nr:uncharacterized protein GSPATT00035115001 [Paramecium tetraurelia]CAK65635.1 unnamed protein product [Paramecium tetraurelia]|eukprot:XP_001433032.1 hypothetical protein (macronuclear) [Paramecium tetraurelia strain d4-2]
MEYMEGGSLKNYMSENPNLNEEQCIQIMKSILSGLTYLHQHNVIHRDIKPDNILLTKDIVPKIADFGLSIQFENFDYSTCKCGTFLYMAPEILQNKLYSKPVDVWATGIIMYQLLQGVHPFYKQDSTKQQYLQTILEKPLQFKKPISSQAKDLLIRLLKIDISDRYTAGQALQHPWLTKQDNLPLSLFEQFKLFDCKNKFINIIKLLIFIQQLKIPKFSYGYILGQQGFHIKQVQYIVGQIGQIQSPLKIESPTISSSTTLKKIGKIDYSEDNTPISLQNATFYQKNKKLQKLSNFYEQAYKSNENSLAQLSPQKPKRSTMNFSQASREYAEIMLGYSAIKEKRKPSQIKLEPLDRRAKRTSSVVVISYKQ